MKQHFEEFKEVKASYGVADKDVYNFDEIEFRAGCERQWKFIKKEEKAYVVLEDPEKRDFITSTKYVSGNRLTILNMIILNKKSYLESFFLYNNLDGNIAMAVNNTGYNNDELSRHCLKHFDKNTWNKRKRV